MKPDWERKEEKRQGKLLRRKSSEELSRMKPSEEFSRVKPSEELLRMKPSEELSRMKPSEELSRMKPSEELLRMKSSEDRERRPALTGFKPLKKEEPSLLETMRLENSRGILALGGDEKKRPALVATEKSRPRGGAVSERDRVLSEKGKREYPLGQNRLLENPGSREEGAAGLLLRPAMTRSQMMAQMKRCMEERGQKTPGQKTPGQKTPGQSTLGRMMPFMVTEKELSGKKRLEEALAETRRRAQRENPRTGQDPSVRLLERCVEEKKEELVCKRQTETYFAERLEKAVREEKKTVWKNSPDWEAVRRRRGAGAADADAGAGKPGEPADAAGEGVEPSGEAGEPAGIAGEPAGEAEEPVGAGDETDIR